MVELQKPRSGDELPRPFDRIGEAGWADRARDVLRAYGVPLPQPATADSVASAELRLGLTLPSAYRCFLLDLGPVDLDGFRFQAPGALSRLDEYWARDAFSRADVALLHGMIDVVDYCGSGDLIALQIETGRCARCGHDPPGVSDWLPSFDAVLQLAFLNLPISYYGWDDDDLEDLIARTQQRLFGTRL
jgi:hypothetical protein